MTISFNQVPSNLRLPFVTAEFDSSNAQQGPALLPYRALLIGQKTGAGTAAANSLHKVTNADQVATLAGRGSMLHRMALAWFASNKSTEAWIGVLADASAAVFATGTLAFTGPATADGTIDLYVGGEHTSVAVSASDSASTIAGNVAAALGKHATGTVTLASAIAADTVTIGATIFVGTSGAVTPGAATFSIDTGDSLAAASLVAQIKAHAVASTKVYASATGAVVSLTSINGGTASNSIVLTSSNGTRLAVTGSGTLAGATADNDAALYASVSSGTVTLHARNAGAAANEIDVRANYRAGESLPDGVGLTITDMASGATNPTLTSLIAAMGDRWFHILANPYTDATSLSALEAELADRAGPLRMIDGVMFSAKNDTYSNCATLGESRNSQFSVIVPTAKSPTAPPEYAACLAGVVARYGSEDPARPFQTLPLPFVLAPEEGDLWTLQERNLLLYDGIATTKVGAGDQVQIERLITTYQTSAAGSPDTAYLDANTPLTLMYLRFTFRNRFATRYPRHKIANDGVRFGAGQAIITPKLAKAEAVTWFSEMMELGLVEGIDQFKADLVVERNGSNPNRLDFLLPPDLVNQLVTVAAQFKFLL